MIYEASSANNCDQETHIRHSKCYRCCVLCVLIADVTRGALFAQQLNETKKQQHNQFMCFMYDMANYGKLPWFHESNG